MRVAKGVLGHWLPIAAVATVLCGLVYLSVQQTLRSSANDPQIQLAEDAADSLARGEPVTSVLPSGRIDVARSPSSFMVVLDEKGEVVGASGLLHGKVPILPPGVLGFARQHGEHRVTWQPEAGVRIATVVIGYDGEKPGFVVVGRSLREIETRIARVGGFALAAWLAALAGSLVLVLACELFLLGERERA
ncbi:MAG: hypothetical protein LAO51_03185 [Acidobacteriia bacterium]|nr:hypothetical protein [Terriglobia bacterium]